MSGLQLLSGNCRSRRLIWIVRHIHIELLLDLIPLSDGFMEYLIVLRCHNDFAPCRGEHHCFFSRVHLSSDLKRRLMNLKFGFPLRVRAELWAVMFKLLEMHVKLLSILYWYFGAIVLNRMTSYGIRLRSSIVNKVRPRWNPLLW